MTVPENASPFTPVPEPPVNLEIMLDLTDGDRAGLQELVAMYLDQTGAQLQAIAAAIQSDQIEIVRREAHSSGGASATLGVMRLAALLKEMEIAAAAKSLAGLPALCEQAQAELTLVQEFLVRANL